METLDADRLATSALLLIDSAPIIYMLEGHKRFAPHFARLFERHGNGEVVFAVTPITLAEVLAGPLKNGAEALARRYRQTLETWQVVAFDFDIAKSAARLRGRYRLKLPDAIQLASALAINADALVTHDRDFATVSGIRILG